MTLKRIICIALALLTLCLTACATEAKLPPGIRMQGDKTYYAIQLPEGKNVENYFELVGQTYYHSMDGGQISYKISYSATTSGWVAWGGWITWYSDPPANVDLYNFSGIIDENIILFFPNTFTENDAFHASSKLLYVLYITVSVRGEEGRTEFHYPDGILVIKENGQWRVAKGSPDCSFYD